jgi:SAM-dependent methyltransferase
MADPGADRVAAGYDLVYEALPRSPTFARLWREHAIGPEYPAGFEHISFLRVDEMRTMATALALPFGGSLVDLACGAGGPGLWIARESGSRILGVDVSAAGLAQARIRATMAGLGGRAFFQRGSFAETGVAARSADGVMSVDALQYAPDKRAAFAEIARILRTGAKFVFACFELDPAKLAGVPVLGDDPVPDYAPLLRDAGFEVESYEETRDWHERVKATYGAVVAARDAIAAEMGDAACAALMGEMTLTLQIEPYRCRVLVVARLRS